MQVRTAAVAAVVVLSLAVAAIVAPETTGTILAVCSLVVFGWALVGLVKPSWARLPNRFAALGVWVLWIGLVAVSTSLINQPADVARAPAQPQPVRPMPDQAARVESVQPVFAVETTGDLRRGRVCPDAGRYYVRAFSPGGENMASAALTLDDGGGGDGLGTIVTAAARFAGGSLGASSERVDLEEGVCYWLSSMSGIEGQTARAELLPAR